MYTCHTAINYLAPWKRSTEFTSRGSGGGGREPPQFFLTQNKILEGLPRVNLHGHPLSAFLVHANVAIFSQDEH